jgi:hypothetical protein
MIIEKIESASSLSKILLPEEPKRVLEKLTEKKSIFILKSLFPKEELLKFRRSLHQWGQSTDQNNPEVKFGAANFHRYDDDPPKAAIKRRMHMYNFFPWNDPLLEERKFLQPIIQLQKEITGLNPDFCSTGVSDGYVCASRVSHYPRGGGYYGRHVDPVELEKCSIIIMMSTRGKDFQTGGLYIDSLTGERIDIEGELECGDVIVFNQAMAHGVAPIDPDATLDWSAESGRWMMFTTFSALSTYQGNFSSGAAKPI